MQETFLFYIALDLFAHFNIFNVCVFETVCEKILLKKLEDRVRIKVRITNT